MKGQPGYPLPSGELGEDEIVCQLVFLPDRPEYWQAFISALHYMATWRAWERDADKRGKDAASNWRAANELTMECWRMACLQELQDNVAEILAIMQLGQSCCDDQDITDGDRYTDRVDDGVGDVPQNIIDAGYAEDAEDWDGFDDYKCMIAHVVVDQLPAKVLEINQIINDYGAAAGGLAAIAAILAVIFSSGGVAIIFGMLMGVGSVSLLYEALMGFPSLSGLAAKVVTNYDELVCSIYRDTDGDVEALASLNDKIDELFTVPEALILKNLGLGPTLKMLYAGRYDQQDIAEILEEAGYELDSFDCETCAYEQEGEYMANFTFPEDDELWENGTWAAPGTIFAPWTIDMYGSSNCIRAKVGLGTSVPADNVTIYRISFDVLPTYDTLNDMRIYIHLTGADYSETDIDVVYGEWNHFMRYFEGGIISDGNSKGLQIDFPSGTGNNYYLDNVIIDFDAPDAV